MATKIGRNDPCPCGSGKKYKQCCGRGDAAQEVAPDSHEYAVARAMAWLGQNHQKAFGTALARTLGEAIEGLFADDEQTQEALAGIDQELWTQIQINLTEWLLAEGDIEVKGEFERVADLLQGPRGPLLSVEQRAWLAQLAQRPLRLYDVTDVAPGATLTLCDALDRDADPVVVTERSGSRTLRPGMSIGARLMEVDGQRQLSGAVYPFSRLGAQATLRALLAGEDEDFEASDEDSSDDEHEPDDDPMLTGLIIIDCWLEQLLLPPMIPDIVDASTGDPLVPTTDHYDVSDWSALSTALEAQGDVEGDRIAGWSRLREDADGQVRALAVVTPNEAATRVSVFYRTAKLAEEGRHWFDALAGATVRFRLQEVSDPKGVLSQPGALQPPREGKSGLPADLDPEVAAGIIEGAIRRSYARWADEPIPALGNRTPRDAIRTEAGLERVKGLLRSYEEGESQQAVRQGRREISYQFLWDALGLER
jgi:hypothetical protein